MPCFAVRCDCALLVRQQQGHIGRRTCLQLCSLLRADDPFVQCAPRIEPSLEVPAHMRKQAHGRIEGFSRKPSAAADAVRGQCRAIRASSYGSKRSPIRSTSPAGRANGIVNGIKSLSQPAGHCRAKPSHLWAPHRCIGLRRLALLAMLRAVNSGSIARACGRWQEA